MQRNDCVVVHSGVQHSADLAAALGEAGRLCRLVTRLQVGAEAPWPWSAKSVQRRLTRRLAPHLADEKIARVDPARAALERWLVWRLPKSLSQRMVAMSRRQFVAAVPQYMPARTRCVVGTDMESGQLFRLLRATRPEIALVLDVSHPVSVVAQQLLYADAQRWGYDPRRYDDYRVGPPLDQRAELELADSILVASEFSAQALQSIGVPRSKIEVVPYGVERPSDSAPGRCADSGSLRVLTLGAVSERKGISHLLRAMDRLQGMRPHIHLDIVGRLAGAYEFPPRLPANVTFHGSLSREHVSHMLMRSDLLALPSMCEGFGRTILEALAYGCAVLTTETSAAPDILAECPNAPITIINTGDRDRLSEYLRTIADDRDTFLRPMDARKAASNFTRSRYLDGVSAAIDAAIMKVTREGSAPSAKGCGVSMSFRGAEINALGDPDKA